MKVLLVIPYFHPKVGGLENYALAIAGGLVKKGWQVVVVTSNHLRRKKDKDLVNGIIVYRLPTLLSLSNTPINPFWFVDLTRIISEEKPDLINGHTPVPFISDVAAIVSFFKKKPFILTYQNDLIKDNALLNIIFDMYYATMGHVVFSIAKRIVVTSSYYANNSKYLLKFKSKLEIIPPGVYLPISRHSSSKNGKLNVLFVGQLSKTHSHKGLDYLLHSIQLLKKSYPMISLTVVGDGDNNEHYKNLAKKLNVDRDISFKGLLDDDELSECYQKATVVVLPSYSSAEAFGMVLIEAAAHHKPVVGSNIGGIPAVISNGQTGFLTEPRNARDLADKIEILFKDPKRASQMGENGFQKVVKDFTWDLQIAKTDKLFKKYI